MISKSGEPTTSLHQRVLAGLVALRERRGISVERIAVAAPSLLSHGSVDHGKIPLTDPNFDSRVYIREDDDKLYSPNPIESLGHATDSHNLITSSDREENRKLLEDLRLVMEEERLR